MYEALHRVFTWHFDSCESEAVSCALQKRKNRKVNHVSCITDGSCGRSSEKLASCLLGDTDVLNDRRSYIFRAKLALSSPRRRGPLVPEG